MTTLNQTCEQFLTHCQSAISLSQHTLRAYTSDLKYGQRFLNGQCKLSTISKENLREYILYLREHKKLKETTIKRRVACLKLLFQWARREGVLNTNPFDTLDERIRLPKMLPRAINSDDANRLKKAIVIRDGQDNHDTLCQKAAICLLLETGMRVGELVAIQISDVSLADSRIKIHGKGNRQRFAYLLSPAAYSAMQSYLPRRQQTISDSQHLFINNKGKPLTSSVVRKALRQTKERAGIGIHITPHMLRHTCATQWLENGLDIRYVQKLLGHHSISTTEIYTHVSDQGLREALMRANSRGR